MIGKTLKAVTQTNEEILFETTDGEFFRQYHDQDCCENVDVEEIIGDLNDLVGSPILVAEERSTEDNPSGAKPSEWDEAQEWTFYELATVKGNVTIRWYGTSNGYYSTSVSFQQKVNDTWERW